MPSVSFAERWFIRMIKNRKDLQEYLLADQIALGRKKKKTLLSDEIWMYEILLRKCEYYNNISPNIIRKLRGGVYRFLRHQLGIKCGFSIPVNTCGKGLCIAHVVTIIINPKVRIGENCRIHAGVNIGADARVDDDVPVIGDNVYIGPGARIFGKIVIANNIAIGANAVVNKDFLKPNVSIAGIPAKVISLEGSKGILTLGG